MKIALLLAYRREQTNKHGMQLFWPGSISSFTDWPRNSLFSSSITENRIESVNLNLICLHDIYYLRKVTCSVFFVHLKTATFKWIKSCFDIFNNSNWRKKKIKITYQSRSCLRMFKYINNKSGRSNCILEKTTL